jgi:hypothetical protein
MTELNELKSMINKERNEEWNKEDVVCFEDWYFDNFDRLIGEYYEIHREDFPTEESMEDIERNPSFQSWCEEQYEEVKQ